MNAPTECRRWPPPEPTLLHRPDGGHARRRAFVDVALSGLHHHDGVVHHNADGQHQAEQAGHVDRKSQQREQREGATIATGTVSSGISVARQFCRNRKTTIITSPVASNNVTITS